MEQRLMIRLLVSRLEVLMDAEGEGAIRDRNDALMRHWEIIKDVKEWLKTTGDMKW